MMPFRLLVPIARRLQETWRLRPQPEPAHDLRRLDEHQQDLQRTRHLLDKARRHGLSLVLPPLRGELLRRVRALQDAVHQVRQQLERPRFALPELADWMAELRQLEAEFVGLRVDWTEKVLTVTTESITLEEVALGPFDIRLSWAHFGRRSPIEWFDVVAQHPNPAAADDRVTHPHVKGRRLCAGDATAPLQQALEQGRLADACCLVRSVLEQYNSGSPHVPLDEWDGTPCRDCGRSVAEDDRSYYEACSSDYCDDCTGSCTACGITRCRGCLTVCAVCDETCCGRCLNACAHSGRDCCPDCLRACAACGAAVARDELAPETDLCPTCQGPPPLARSAEAIHSFAKTRTACYKE